MMANQLIRISVNLIPMHLYEDPNVKTRFQVFKRHGGPLFWERMIE